MGEALERETWGGVNAHGIEGADEVLSQASRYCDSTFLQLFFSAAARPLFRLYLQMSS
jgi:hypothetical protein